MDVDSPLRRALKSRGRLARKAAQMRERIDALQAENRILRAFVAHQHPRLDVEAVIELYGAHGNIKPRG